jgi:hypothetical protein
MNSKPLPLTGLLLLTVVGSLWAGSSKKVGEPASVSVLSKGGSPSEAQIVPLESKLIRRKRIYHALGFAGVTLVYFMEGDRSPLRLKGPTKAEFVVRLSGDLDPAETILFYQFNQVDGSRVLPIAFVDALDRVSQPTPKPVLVDFSTAKFDSSSFKLLPTQPLVPGEYCMLIKVRNDLPNPAQAFCFGVDASVN